MEYMLLLKSKYCHVKREEKITYFYRNVGHLSSSLEGRQKHFGTGYKKFLKLGNCHIMYI